MKEKSEKRRWKDGHWLGLSLGLLGLELLSVLLIVLAAAALGGGEYRTLSPSAAAILAKDCAAGGCDRHAGTGQRFAPSAIHW